MTPRNFILDTSDCLRVNPKPSCDCSLLNSILAQSSYLSNVIWIELCAPHLLSSPPLPAKNPVGVDNVFRRSSPFKIIEAIVIGVSVFMVCPLSVIVNSIKRYKHKSVDVKHFPTKTYSPIPSWVGHTNHDSVVGMVHSVFSPKTPHGSIITDCVLPDKTRHWTPLLDVANNLLRHIRPFCLRLNVKAGEMAVTIRPLSVLCA